MIAFVEKPPKDEAPTNLINAGIYVLEPDVLDLIPDGRRVSVERETFPALAEKGALYARADEAYWLDTGTPEAYLHAQSDILAGIRLAGIRGEPPAPGAERDSGGAWVIGAPIVDGSADARSLIGDGALVESGAVVAGSVVGAGCVVGAGATVTGSVLLAGSRLGGGAQSRVLDHRVESACRTRGEPVRDVDRRLRRGGPGPHRRGLRPSPERLIQRSLRCE